MVQLKLDQYGIEIVKLIHSIWYIQDDNKKDVMTEVESVKQVYLFYKPPYHSSVDYMEEFKSHIKLSEAHNGALGYH